MDININIRKGQLLAGIWHVLAIKNRE